MIFFLVWRLLRQKNDLLKLIQLVHEDRDRIGPGIRDLVDLVAEIANAAAQSGSNDYLLAKRLDRILSSPRGEGRTIKDEFLVLADLYDSGLLSWLGKEFPALTRSEIGLCGMLTLGMEPACISKILCYDHEQTFYNKRTDIRKKLRLKHNESLEGYLNGQAERLRQEHETVWKKFRQP